MEVKSAIVSIEAYKFNNQKFKRTLQILYIICIELLQSEVERVVLNGLSGVDVDCCLQSINGSPPAVTRVAEQRR